MNDIWNKIKDKILALIQTEFRRNYASGTPQIPPHRHNAIDNLKIAASDLSGTLSTSQLSGNFVSQITAGTNITLTPSTGVGTVKIDASGGGGSPGGNNTDVQFNNSSAFGGQDSFTFDKTNNILKLQSSGYYSQISSGTKSIQIISAAGAPSGYMGMYTGVASANNTYTGSIALVTGKTTHTGVTTGGIFLKTGYSSSDSVTTGDIKLFTGHSNGATAQTGSIRLYCYGSSGSSSGGGSIIMKAGNATYAGAINLYAGATSGATGPLIKMYGSSTSAGGKLLLKTGTNGSSTNSPDGVEVQGGLEVDSPGTIKVVNSSGDPSTPSGSGIIYTKSGALYYKGSSGTVTPLAPA